MKNRCKVFCLGYAVADILARPVDHLAPSGTSQPLEDVALGPGGNGINTAIAPARQGVAVRVAAAIGNDQCGESLKLAARYANAAGALATLGLGGADSAPTISQLEDFLQSHSAS